MVVTSLKCLPINKEIENKCCTLQKIFKKKLLSFKKPIFNLFKYNVKVENAR